MKKYEKVRREDYDHWYLENQAYRELVRADADRLAYHLMPETGWLNDPNGLCQLDGVYHIYYQYTPFEPTGEIKLWGHVSTRDFVHYVQEEPVLFPDQDFDAHGVYSGSAWIEQGRIHYFYTGNVKYLDGEYDYINSGREGNTIHCTSRDGRHFSDKELLLSCQDYPPDMSAHIRDPKLCRHGDAWYMVLGARDKKDKGLVLVYRSQDLISWSYHGRITTREAFGYMWECPDLFMLDGQLCLMCCPQGVNRRGLDFQNVHQCVITPLSYDFSEGVCYVEQTQDFRMVDRGFDFYAPQTFEDEKGRRILIGWMGIPDADYTNPTVKQGWQHALTIPRRLHMEGGRLIQSPLEELCELRGEKRVYGKAELETGIDAGTVFEAVLELDTCLRMEMTLRGGVTLTYESGLLTLDMGNSGSGRTKRSVELAALQSLRIFSDTSSLEIFVNGGKEVFTTRVYDHDRGLGASGEWSGGLILYEMRSFVYTKRQQAVFLPSGSTVPSFPAAHRAVSRPG